MRTAIVRTLSLLLVVLGCAASASAQTSSTGPHLYAIENLDNGGIDRRGEAGSLGTAFSQLILAPNPRYRVWILSVETRKIGRLEFETGPPGSNNPLPPIRMTEHNTLDDDALNYITFGLNYVPNYPFRLLANYTITGEEEPNTLTNNKLDVLLQVIW